MTASRRPSPMLIRSPGSLYSRGVACEQAVLKIQRIWSLRSAEVKNDLCIIFWYWNTVRYHVDLVYAIKSAKHKNMWLVKISNRKHREIRPFCCHPTLEVYGYSETTLSTKIFFSTYRCLFFTQTQSDQNPHTKSALFSTSSITFLRVGDDWFQGTSFLDARDHAWSNGKDALQSIALEKKSMFSTRSFSSVPP